MSKKYNLFWSGPYSQWDASDFTINGIEFSCAEQWMMVCKALCFEDCESAVKIMSTYNPSEQKAYGRLVANFDADVWDKINYSLVYAGNVYKFTQSKEHHDYIMSDMCDEIVEASPYDKIWGIGLRENDPRCQDKTQWKGENRLGRVCTELRDFMHNPEGNGEILEHFNHLHVMEDFIEEHAEDFKKLKEVQESL